MNCGSHKKMNPQLNTLRSKFKALEPLPFEERFAQPFLLKGTSRAKPGIRLT
jgi:hypothetical protein